VSVLSYRGQVSGAPDTWTKRAWAVGRAVLAAAGMTARKRAVAVRAHMIDHIYTWLAMGFIDAAAYVHSLFSGLLVTGVLWFLFEMKVGELCRYTSRP